MSAYFVDPSTSVRYNMLILISPWVLRITTKMGIYIYMIQTRCNALQWLFFGTFFSRQSPYAVIGHILRPVIGHFLAMGECG